MTLDTMRDPAATTDYGIGKESRVRTSNQNRTELDATQVSIQVRGKSLIGVFQPLVSYIRSIPFGQMVHVVMSQNRWSTM